MRSGNLFNSNPSDIVDFSGLSPAQVFDQQVVPRFNELESKAFEIDLDGEDTRAREVLAQQTQEDELFFQELDQESEERRQRPSNLFEPEDGPQGPRVFADGQEQPTVSFDNSGDPSGNSPTPEGPAGKAPASVASTASLSSGKGFQVFDGSRDELKDKRSSPGNRKISLDFNAPGSKGKFVRGIEIVVPSNATKAEIQASKDYAKGVQAFFKEKGLKVPLRGDDGIALKANGKRRHGKAGFFHPEPFFNTDVAARKAIEDDPDGFASVVAGTLGRIGGSTFIAPHTKTRSKAIDRNPGPGATSGRFSERSFALEKILPSLRKIQAQ